MQYPRTMITVLGLALTGVSAMVDSASADPAPPPFPATLVGAEAAGEAGPAHQVFEAEVNGDRHWEVAKVDGDTTITDVERAPDGTVFFATTAGDTNEIRRLAPTEQAHYRVADGWAPAVSPDGRLLAFAYFPEGGDICSGNNIGVLDLTTGDLRRFLSPPDAVAGPSCPDTPGFVTDITWAPDSRFLAFVYGDADTGNIRRLDTVFHDYLDEAYVLDPTRRYDTPAWLADGRLAVTEAHGARFQVMAVDVETRVATAISPVFGGHRVNSLDADAGGRNLLIAIDGASHATEVYALRAGEAPTPLAPAFPISVW
ncbi:MAG: TolB family protein [Acidimicrobiia bacterium]